MCGIAGRIISRPGTVGADLVLLMEAQEHRGADSTGFAIYGEPLDSGYIVRVMGSDRGRIGEDLDEFRQVLRAHGSDFSSDPVCDRSSDRHVTARLVVDGIADIAAWAKDADTLMGRLEILSVGRSLEIVKDLGGATQVADKHGLREMVGTHGLGHARLATESSVLPTASHPFWARPFPDVAIVHNGQITDYFTWRRRLERAGYRFVTQNDSELIAVWVSDQISRGLTKPQALGESIRAIDGVFTFLISDTDSIGFAKDKFAIKPLVSVDENGNMAVATEEQAVRTIYRDEVPVRNHDGPGLTGIWGAGGGRRAAA